ncbi:MAG: RNA-directed DNA polymerase [Candidatus Saccharimonadales bacterium]
MELNSPERALDILKYDIANMNFVRFPFEYDIFHYGSTDLIKSIREQLVADSYQFSHCTIAEVPKGKNAVRPGALLSIRDQFAYTLLGDKLYSYIRPELMDIQGVSDFGYQFEPIEFEDSWFRSQFSCWEKWKFDSLDKINSGAQFVVFTDVTGCYENIDINLLMSDLRRIGTPAPLIKPIRNALKAWGIIDTKGLPQGLSTSHLLAKLYLSQIDRDMKSLGYTQTRFVDDIRIFCSTLNEAKKALADLTQVLRKRGLNMQSAKLKIMPADKAASEILGKASVIAILQERLIGELSIEDLEDNPYAPSYKVNTTAPNMAQLIYIKQYFIDNFISAPDEDFDKSLFHYLLNKLGMAHSDFAVDYCVKLFDKHPEETKDILKYLSRQFETQSFIHDVASVLTDDKSVYDYQNFQITEFLFESRYVSEEFKTYLRKVAFNNNKPVYFRALCKQILGWFAEYSDLIAIKDSLMLSSSAQEKDAIICSLNKLEKGVRNSYFTDLSSRDNSAVAAIAFTKQLS